MKIVRQYTNSKEFEKGIDKERAKGWVLHSWKLSVGYSMVIVAVYSSRS